MAKEVVGRASLSASLQALIDKMASAEMFDFISAKKLNESLLEKLKIKLLSANAVLNDAEEKQVRNPGVRMWLAKLQEAIYDAEDLVQEIYAEALGCEMDVSYFQLRKSFWNMYGSFNKKLEFRTTDILDKLNYIVREKDLLGLKEDVQTRPSRCDTDDIKTIKEEVFQDVQDANLMDDTVWKGYIDDLQKKHEELKEKHEVIFDRLQPVTEFQKQNYFLWVHQIQHIPQYLYGAKTFSNWGGYGSFSCLVKVDLVCCKSCYWLPPLGQLPSLKKLHIQGFDRVERIGDEFYSTDTLSLSKPFKSLENLTFSHMLRWKEWSFMESGVFSDLTELTLDNCRKLKGMCYLPSLKSLLILGCTQVVASLSTDCLPLLSTLKIGHFKELESFPIRTLPENVHTIKIMGCKELVSLSEDGWPSKLESLEISYCSKLFGNSLWWNLRTVTSLTSLQIIKIDEVVHSFPEEWQLPTTLKSLTLSHFRNLKSLNGKALQHLTSLKELKIEFCHHLHYLPEEGLPESLSQLEIFGCGFLNGRCQKERGEDWPKISHIPHIQIDCKEI